MKQYKQKSNTSYFLFWICLFLMLGFIVQSLTWLLPLLKNLNMSRINASQEQTLQDEKQMDDSTVTSSDMSDMPSGMSSNMPSGMSSDMFSEGGMTYMGTNAPLFTQGDIVPVRQFKNERGSVFIASSLQYTGVFPQDFAQKDIGPKVLVDVSFDIGWIDLPNLIEIDVQARNQQSHIVKIPLPRLTVFNLKIETDNDNIDTPTMNDIKESISQYIYTLFEHQEIPFSIIEKSYTLLTSAYQQLGYEDIDLVPYNK